MAEEEPRFKIRCMKPEEIDRVAKLIRDLQDYQKIKHCPRLPYGKDLQDEILHRDKQGNLVANNYNIFTAVAIDSSRLNEPDYNYVVGYLIYCQSFSIVHGRHIYMNSFFIDEKYRRHGIGSKFMEFMRLHAVATKNEFLDVPFMNNNIGGQKFYSTFGAYSVNDEYQMMAKKISEFEASVCLC